MKTLIVLSSIAAALSSGLLGCAAGTVEDDSELAAGVEEGESAFFATPPPPVPAPEDVYIESISTGGAGCPNPGDASGIISSDRQSFVVIFDKMMLEYPPPPLIKILNCVAGVKLHIPAGWQFSVATVNTRGYASLSQGLTGRQTSSYFFAGNPIASAWHSTLTGYFNDYYSFTDNIGFGSWSKCGGDEIFAINTAINLNAVGNPGGNGIMNVETVDGVFRKILQWAWRPC